MQWFNNILGFLMHQRLLVRGMATNVYMLLVVVILRCMALRFQGVIILLAFLLQVYYVLS